MTDTDRQRFSNALAVYRSSHHVAVMIANIQGFRVGFYAIRTNKSFDMKDLRGKLDKLRADAQDCALMSMSATNPEKREMFERLADQLAIEALELEQVVKRQTAHLGSNHQDNVVNVSVCSERERG